MQLRLLAALCSLPFAVAIDTWEIIPLVGPTGTILAEVKWTQYVSFDLAFCCGNCKEVEHSTTLQFAEWDLRKR